MAEEVEDYHNRLEAIEADVEKIIAKAKKTKDPIKRGEAVADITAKLKTAKDLLKSLRVELMDLDGTDAQAYQAKAKDHNDCIQKLQADTNWIKSEAEKQELGTGDGHGGRATPKREPQNMDEMTAGELINRGEAIQGQSLASTSRAKRLVNEAKDIGTKTVDTLRSQRDQIMRVGDDVNKVQDNLKRADAQLKEFARRMMTDKIILGFMCLIICAIIFVVIYTSVKPGSVATNTPDVFKST